MPDFQFGLLTRSSLLDPGHWPAIANLLAEPGVHCVAWLELDDRITGAPAQAESIDISPLVTAPRERGSAEALAARARALNLAFIFFAGPGAVPDAFENTATHGLWYIQYGLGQPLGFWEIHSRCLLTTVSLRTPQAVLMSAVVKTEHHSFSLQRQTLLQAGLLLPVRAARALQAGALDPQPAPVSHRNPPNRWAQAVGHLRRGIALLTDQIYGTLQTEIWNTGVVPAPIHRFLDPDFTPHVDWLPSFKEARFVADPFLLETPQGTTLLLEEFDYARNQGYITALPYPGGQAGPAGRVVIDEGVHMSYPFLVSHGGETYCIPESRRNREVALFRLDPATGSWHRHQTLIRDFPALDSTVIQCDGRWWLFCTSQDNLPECNLYLWHAPSLFGPWEPHRQNPVKCDVRSSRPGGTPFVVDGSWYRPAQDSSRGYGSALTINRIQCLTPESFREQPVRHWSPIAPWSDGLHTLSGSGDRTVIDGKRMAWVPQLIRKRLMYKLNRLLGRKSGVA